MASKVNTAAEAARAVVEQHPYAADWNLFASRVEDYAGYWYVTARDDDGGDLFGGSAFVLSEKTGLAREVAASVPPEDNLWLLVEQEKNAGV